MQHQDVTPETGTDGKGKKRGIIFEGVLDQINNVVGSTTIIRTIYRQLLNFSYKRTPGTLYLWINQLAC